MDRGRWICSSLVVRACIAAGLICPGDLNPEGVCPRDLAEDRWLDLRPGWHKPVRLNRPGGR